jgi:hypothetical protein
MLSMKNKKALSKLISILGYIQYQNLCMFQPLEYLLSLDDANQIIKWLIKEVEHCTSTTKSYPE